MKEELKKKELIIDINYNTFLNPTTSVADVYIDINHREAHETTYCI